MVGMSDSLAGLPYNFGGGVLVLALKKNSGFSSI